MIVFFVGAVNGHIIRLYEEIEAVENKIGYKADWVLCTGSLGTWPDPNRADRPSKGRVGDFPKLYFDQEPVPRQTIFVAGPHEDHVWLKHRAARQDLDLLPGLTWLMDGYSTVIGTEEYQAHVAGLGKVYSPSTYTDSESIKHYTYLDIQRACSGGPCDVFLCHEGMYGEFYGPKKCEARGIKKVIYAIRPKLIIHGHFNYSKSYFTLDTPTISLATGEILPMQYDGEKFKRL